MNKARTIAHISMNEHAPSRRWGDDISGPNGQSVLFQLPDKDRSEKSATADDHAIATDKGILSTPGQQARAPLIIAGRRFNSKDFGRSVAFTPVSMK